MAKKRQPQPQGTILMPNQVADLLLPAHLAVSNLRCNCFSAASWRDLAFLSDITQLLAAEAGNQAIVDHGIGMGRCLLSIRERRSCTKVWGATEDELKAMQKHILALDAFLRQQPSHKILGAQIKRDAAVAHAQAQGRDQAPIELNQAQLRAGGRLAQWAGRV